MRNWPRLGLVLVWTLSYLLLLWQWRHGFHLWNQINDLYHGTGFQYAPIDPAAWSEPAPLALFAQLPRMALAFPVLAIARALQADPHLVFTAAGIMLVAASAWWLARASERRLDGYWVALSALSLAMNGRMLFGLAGAALLLWASARPLSGAARFTALLAGLWLCSVSTGTVAVACLWVAWLLWDWWRDAPRERWPTALALLVASPWFVAALAKNALYFLDTEAGVWLGLLGHGVGRMLASLPDMLSWQFATILLALGWRFRARVTKLLRLWHPAVEAYPFLALSLFGGLFGYSTLIMVVPPGLALLASALPWMAPQRYSLVTE